MTKKERGAYYTPYALADKMCDKIITNGSVRFLEPSFGDGVFIDTIKLHCKKLGISKPIIKGVEVDYETARKFNTNEVPAITSIEVRDFLSLEEDIKYDVIIGNPPYIMTKTTPLATQKRTKELSALYNLPNSLNNSLWFSFILKSLTVLAINGSISFVLPATILTVTYAKRLFTLLSSLFSSVTIDRIHESVFEDALVQTVILTCRGYDDGTPTDYIKYNAYNRLTDYIEDNCRTTAKIYTSSLADRFLDNLPLSFSDTLTQKINEMGLLPVKELCKFKQGYVAGHSFFHPTKEKIKDYGIEDSLIPCIASGRSLNKATKIKLTENDIEDKLFFPKTFAQNKFTENELMYIYDGEIFGISQKYKCRNRNPWFVVPNITYPDIVIPFLFDVPRLLINNGIYTNSCSILGGALPENISPELFVCCWYNSLTLFNIERTVKQLGGGCLNFTPNTINNLLIVPKIPQEKINDIYYQLNKCYETGDIASVYKLGDQLVLRELYGFTTEEIEELENTVEEMRKLRNSKV